MHRRIARSFLLLGALSAVGAAALPAQTSLFAGGGISRPTGASSYEPTGWLLSGGIMFPVGAGGLSLGIEGDVGDNGWDTMAGAFGLVSYRFGDRTRTGGFLTGGAGGLVFGDWAQPLFLLGGGVEMPIGKVGLFGALRIGFGSDYSAMWLTGGVTIPLGKRK